MNSHRATSGICRQNRNGVGRYPIETARTYAADDQGPLVPLAALDLRATKFVVVGAGRVGSSIALALGTLGAQLAGYIAGSPEGSARASAWLGVQAASGLDELVSCSPDMYVVAVPDEVLPSIATELGALLRTGRPPGDSEPLVLHTSGASSVAVLAPCADAGALTLVFHPLQTFPDPASGSARLPGAAVAITPGSGGVESAAALLGFALARSLGARPFFLPDDRRALYHAAATIACNYFVTLEYLASRLFVRASIPDQEAFDLFLPLVTATLDNLREDGPVAALTGPLSRGDADTVSRHLAALAAEEPSYLKAYQVLGLATLDLVRAQQALHPRAIEELARLLSRPVVAPGDELHGARISSEETGCQAPRT